MKQIKLLLCIIISVSLTSCSEMLSALGAASMGMSPYNLYGTSNYYYPSTSYGSGYTSSGSYSSSSGSSTSYSSSSSSGKMCGLCAGSGQCKTCSGKGYYYSSFDLSKTITCPNCKNHNGRCSSCNGTGHR